MQGGWNEIELHADNAGIGSMNVHVCSKNGRTSLSFYPSDPDAGHGAYYHKIRKEP
jgi:hypothetical protein